MTKGTSSRSIVSLSLLDIVKRDRSPEPWAEGDNIPWHEPGFSQRMLREHLSQDHDAASRRLDRVEQAVGWIHRKLLHEQASRVLDLGCGPGLYASRLARRGHTCLGIDYSPASVAYARETAEREGLACEYVLQDIREADYGVGHDLAMLIYGELNIFRPGDARRILSKARAALRPGGTLLLEPHTFEAARGEGQRGTTWFSSTGGLFSERPHLCLTDCRWDEPTQTSTVRHYVVDAETGAVTRYAQTYQAYDEAGYRELLAACGFVDVRIHPTPHGADYPGQDAFMVIVARRED